MSTLLIDDLLENNFFKQYLFLQTEYSHKILNELNERNLTLKYFHQIQIIMFHRMLTKNSKQSVGNAFKDGSI